VEPVPTVRARVVFVGEASSNGHPVAFAGDNPGGAGRRLASLLGVTVDEMHARENWTFVNLFRGPLKAWDAKLARDASNLLCTDLCARFRGYHVILVYLGRRVAEAMNYRRPFFEVSRYSDPVGGSTHVVVPHPSGRCRLWNDVRNVTKFRKVMRETGVLHE
jgi:hypothetical protein